MRIAPGRPLLIGHRGAPLVAPENTLASFRAAFEAGLDGVEIDVHRTRDGVLAVHHDPVTAAGLDIAATDWPDLVVSNPDLPRLEQVLGLLEGYDDRFLNIELKSRFPWDDGRDEALARALLAWTASARDRTWVSCFDPLALLHMQRHHTPVPLALLAFGTRAWDIPDLIPTLDIDGLHVEHHAITAEALTRWHARGWFVYAWTVNDRARAEELVRAGIDGIIGDHPAHLKAALGADRLS